jgi:uncharacterized protein (DUF1330 family)
MPLKPTGEQIKALVNSELDGPVVMLNLLKYAERATGAAAASGITGEQSYEKYGEEMQSRLAAVGARLLWRGRADSVVIGTDADDWDEVLLMEYPSRKAFLEMTSQKDFEKTSEHRTNALADSRLIAMTELFRNKA